MKIDFAYKNKIKNELERRKKKNPRYSARALAKNLDIDVATISRIISGKLIPSKKTALKISNGLMMSAEESHHFNSSVADAQTLKVAQELMQKLKKSHKNQGKIHPELLKVLSEILRIVTTERMHR